jgi:hypothetical protein
MVHAVKLPYALSIFTLTVLLGVTGALLICTLAVLIGSAFALLILTLVFMIILFSAGSVCGLRHRFLGRLDG